MPQAQKAMTKPLQRVKKLTAKRAGAGTKGVKAKANARAMGTQEIQGEAKAALISTQKTSPALANTSETPP